MTARGAVLAPWLLAGLLAATEAGAEDTRGWNLTVEAGTDFPLAVGGRLGLESPWRLHLSTSLGYLPPAYVRAVNGVAVAVGAYERTEAELLEDALRSSLVWRTHVGWRPFPGAGFYVEGGYGLVALGGETNPEEVLVALTGIDPPVGETVLDRRYRVRSVLHMADAEVGWRWGLGPGLTARAALGAALTLDANSRVEPQFEPGQPLLVRAFSRFAEGRLDDTLERSAHFPLLSLSLGYAF